jgi:autophagy-related protein 11
VFNKQFLDLEIDEVLTKLYINSTSAPHLAGIILVSPLNFTDTLLAASLSTSSLGAELLGWMSQLISAMKNQLEALRIASSNLDINLLTISDTYESFAESAQMELKNQEQLLQNIDIDLEVISKVKIHPEFLSPAARRSQESGERSRTLGDYVSNSKMKQVAENCATLHGEPFFPRTCISQCLNFCQRICSNVSLQYMIHSIPL